MGTLAVETAEEFLIFFEIFSVNTELDMKIRNLEKKACLPL